MTLYKNSFFIDYYQNVLLKQIENNFVYEKKNFVKNNKINLLLKKTKDIIRVIF